MSLLGRFSLWLVFSSMVFAVSCGKPTGDAKKLVGTWQGSKVIAVATFTFSDDFTFSSQISSFFGGVAVTGEWRINDDQLITKIKTHSDNEDIGKETICRILKVDDSSLVLQTIEDDGRLGDVDRFVRVN